MSQVTAVEWSDSLRGWGQFHPANGVRVLLCPAPSHPEKG